MLLLNNTATTAAGPMGAMVLTLMSPRLILAGAYLSRLDALPLIMSCDKTVGHLSACSSQRYLRSMMGRSTR